MITMAETNNGQMGLAFAEAKEKMALEMKEVYQDIFQNIKTLDMAELAGQIPMQESTKINRYMRTLRQDLKSVAVAELIRCGLPSYETEVTWASIMQQVGLPQIELCRKEAFSGSDKKERADGSSAAHAEERRDKDRERRQLEQRRNQYAAVMAAGAAVEVVSWLTVPGWGMVGILAKGAGIVVMAAGAMGTYTSQQKITEIDRIYTADRQAADRQKQVSQLAETICQKQCERNTKIIGDWIDQVASETEKQYINRSER
mgnify:CR=1 FL=1